MNKLEVGMYVRTKDGCICKILKETYSKYLSRNKEFCYEVDRPINVNMELYNEDVLKARHNIIDLIEVGDYVNGFRVDEVEHSKSTIFIGNTEKVIEQALWSNDIKSIVTKEAFQNAEYRVETN